MRLGSTSRAEMRPWAARPSRPTLATMKNHHDEHVLEPARLHRHDHGLESGPWWESAKATRHRVWACALPYKPATSSAAMRRP